jgi:hypothetical protein
MADRYKNTYIALYAYISIIIVIAIFVLHPIVTQSDTDFSHLIIFYQRETPGTNGAHGLDFSQVYFSAQNLMKNREVYYPISKENFRILRRPWSSSYHPFTHWVYQPLAFLPFHIAFYISNGLQIILLLLSFFVVLKHWNAQRLFPLLALATLCLIFLTPIGLYHLERGQFDIFTATTYTWLLAFLLTKKTSWGIWTAIFSILKVSSQIFVGLFWILTIILKKSQSYHLYVLPIAIATIYLIFLPELPKWMHTVSSLEVIPIWSMSFTQVFPKTLVRLYPIAVTGILCVYAYKRTKNTDEVFVNMFLPAAITLVLIATCTTFITHEYRSLALIGLLPYIAIWPKLKPNVDEWVVKLTVVIFIYFLLAVLYLIPFDPFDPKIHSAHYLLFAYLFFSIIFFIITLYIINRSSLSHQKA